MRGRTSKQVNLFVNICLEDLVPAGHPLRGIKKMADKALADMSRTFAAAYSKVGRPSVPPERLIKAVVLMSLYTIRSERQLCERITFDMLFRWFLDMTPDELAFDHSDFSKNRDRLERLDVTKKFSDQIVFMAYEAGLISEDHFSMDGSLIQSLASLKSLKHKDAIKAEKQKQKEGEKGKDDTKSDPPADSNSWVDFKGEKRSNKTHQSQTDPEARLYTKASGVAFLQHMMHVVMENRLGLGLGIHVGAANGTSERTCGLKILDRIAKRFGLKPTTLGLDKGYDAGEFLAELDERGIQPHAACKSKKPLDVPRADDEQAWARWFNQRGAGERGYKTSQRKRKLIEEIFGWLKTIGGLRRAKVAGRWKIQQFADIALGSLNLVRMSKLLAV